MMKKGSRVLLAAGILSLLALGTPNFADANARNRQKKLDKSAHHELNNATSELQRDRADLRNLYRSGASRTDIDRKREEIRGDLSQIYQDRGQLGSYGGHRNDYGWYGNRSRRSQNDDGWWNWGWNRSNRRDRWARDYRND
ncbi:MAG TPA: hypothetical protein VMT22_13985 [Terriglobales bacterium]|jgi:hypothetical protein|nr:hypothetical protein [Terriglobales bacterium]